MPPTEPRPHELDPPFGAFGLILASAVLQLTGLMLVDRFFASTGIELMQHRFAISQLVAGVAGFVGNPAGTLAAILAIFLWCRAAGWAVRSLMARSITRDEINELVEPLVVLMNMAFFGLVVAGMFLSVAHVCR